ncbi:TauD/TfdA family dioxygenase [Henriciella algicola]|uniref:TauD/TfdA-like domain-containing protein n=1 Tax=Henriciella algicola TaxID=1608422 RepID=A0A399RDX2_9PROT|nr:TauD/TfdA family dioxygenase [Henriciella algicola]RIJ29628.1 hypothetical protein D1222_09585 [Henriciella algicola]
MADGFYSNIPTRTVQLILSDEEKLSLEQAILDGLARIGTDRKIDAILDLVCTEMSEAFRDCLSSGHRAAIQDFRRNKDALALHISNTPRLAEEDIPPTPYRRPDAATERAMLRSDAKVLGLIGLAGFTPFASPSENQGYAFRNVLAAAGKEESQSSHGSAEFGLHMDNPSAELSSEAPACMQVPRILAFDCIRNFENIPTELERTISVLNEIKHGAFKYLAHRAFAIEPPQSNEVSIYAPSRRPTPLLEEDDEGNLVLRYDPTSVSLHDPDPRYQKTLANLQAVLAKTVPSSQITLQPGHFLMFKNRQVLHMRRAFNPLEDRDQSRWLRRLYAV